MDGPAKINGIPTRLLGSKGVRVTAIGVGGYHIGKVDPALAVRIVRSAIDEGINFLDNAWCYNGGESERIMGDALRDGYRDKVFLMTKNHGRDAATFVEQLEESLRRLQVERIDLLQFHEIGPAIPEQIVGQGALEEALKARDSGKIRFIGFTGHLNPRWHRQMLVQGFPWDTVQMPINVLDAQYESFTRQVLPRLKSSGIGAIGMKSLAGGRLLAAGVSAEEGIPFALSQAIDVLVTGIDSMEVLAQNLGIARSWTPMGDSEQRELMARVADKASDGSVEYSKPE